MDDLIIISDKLGKILNNFKKSPNRVNTKEFIKLKKEEVNDLKIKFVKILDVLKENKFTEIEIIDLKKIKKKFEDNLNFLIELLNKVDENENISNIDEINTAENQKLDMANFNLVEAFKIIPDFAGNHADLNKFLGLTELYYESIKIDDRTKLINFILKAKINDRVRNRIGKIEETFTALKNSLVENFKNARTTISVQTELFNKKQGNKSVKQYVTQIEDLLASLNGMQINEQGEQSAAVIEKLNNQTALHAFTNGLNEPLKTTICAARPKLLAEACKLAIDYDVDHQNREPQIMSINRNNFNRNNFNNNRNNFNRVNFNRNLRYNSSNYNNGHNNNFNNNYRNRNGINNNNRSNNSYNSDHRNYSNNANNYNRNRNYNSNHNNSNGGYQPNTRRYQEKNVKYLEDSGNTELPIGREEN